MSKIKSLMEHYDYHYSTPAAASVLLPKNIYKRKKTLSGSFATSTLSLRSLFQ